MFQSYLRRGFFMGMTTRCFVFWDRDSLTHLAFVAGFSACHVRNLLKNVRAVQYLGGQREGRGVLTSYERDFHIFIAACVLSTSVLDRP